MSRLSEKIKSIESGMAEHFRRRDSNSMYELWKMLLESINETEHIKINHHYERKEDMSSDRKIQVFIENDGDAILTIISNVERESPMTSVQFCTKQGGGQSPNVRRALFYLAKAIEEDNLISKQY